MKVIGLPGKARATKNAWQERQAWWKFVFFLPFDSYRLFFQTFWCLKAINTGKCLQDI